MSFMRDTTLRKFVLVLFLVLLAYNFVGCSGDSSITSLVTNDVLAPTPTPTPTPPPCVNPTDPFEGGSGIELDPYQICSVTHLESLRADVMDADNSDGHAYAAGLYYKLTADIDLDGVNFAPIGDAGAAGFAGSFDGNNKTISNWTYSATGVRSIGFFSWIDGVAVIKNLTLENVSLTSDWDYVGGLTGSIDPGSLVSNCHVSGSVVGTAETGGLIGYSAGTLEASSFSGTVDGGDYCSAGLVGENNGGLIRSSHATATVTMADCCGGIISGCEMGTIEKSWGAGTVTGVRQLGGLAGWSAGTAISNSYSTAAVTGTDDDAVGGLVGDFHGTITNSYSTGLVQGGGVTEVGGLVGFQAIGGTATDSFWDTDTSGLGTSAAGTGKTTAEMQLEGTFTNWDFTTVWEMPAGGGYPVLR